MTRPGDFEIDQYASFQTSITWREDDGSVIDLTGYSAKMDIREGYGGELILSLTSDDDSIDIIEEEGKLAFYFTPEQTADFDFVRAYYDVVVTSPTGFATRIIEGVFELNKGITQ